jgi:hypothetical protein
VQSLADTLEAAFGSDSQSGDGRGDGRGDNVRASAINGRRNVLRASRDSSRATRRDPDSCRSSPPRTSKRDMSTHSLSNPLSPLNAESRSPMPPSALPSTPNSASLHSFKLSDDETGSEEGASQVVASGCDDEDETAVNQSGSFPQLVMPSIQMPSRRPFTTKGKAMGKLKVLVAGQAGTFSPYHAVDSMQFR